MNSLNFVEFFTDIYKYPPLPWQQRLAAKLVEDHTWPDLIDLPTASGKTACLDIALFHLAWCAERSEAWRAARRIVMVVDRRIIVDSAASRAKELREQLANPRTEAIRRVAIALGKLGGGQPLVCEKLRGGMPRERGIALNPAQPMIITSTVDQIGSRLLFRGYGLSPYTHPIHAGLLGYDTLLLVDEAHLSVPFIETVAAIRVRQGQAERPVKSVQPVRLVPLSATAETEGTKFQLDTTDLANEQLAARRTARKSARLVSTSGKFSERVKILSRETLDVYRRLDSLAPAVAVIVNRVRTARALYESLLAEKGRFDVELMIGRGRPLDRDAVAARVMARAGAGVSSENDSGLIVVATQTIEVGADLDFEGLVTECAAIDALRQRFGRLDRLGKFRKAQAAIVGGDDADDDPVYGAALSRTWSWLESVASEIGGHPVVDFSTESMERLTKEVEMSPMNSTLRERLALTPVHIDLLSQTSPTPMFEPDIQALLHGLRSGVPDVQVVWRADLPVTSGESLLDVSEFGVAKRLLELNPPASLESLSLPLMDVRAWLQGRRDETGLADVEGTSEGEAKNDTDAKCRLVLRWAGDGWKHALISDIKPGDTLVVPSSYGGCDKYGFAPNCMDDVTDLSARARLALDKSALVVITEGWIESIGIDIEKRRSIWRALQDNQISQALPFESLALLLDEISHLITPELEWLRRTPVLDVVLSADEKLHAIVATEGVVRASDISDEDFSSSFTVSVSLEQHNAGVARHARALAQVLSLEAEHVEHVGQAGGFHDIGKADPRVQQALRSGDSRTLAGQLLAKGLRHSNFGRVETAERHEAYSVAFLRRYPRLLNAVADPDLVLYLIGTHHGRGRALMPDRSDEGAAFAIELAGQIHQFDGVPALGSLGSGWATLFWSLNRRYGPWGLAYLESILRLADWMRSAEEIKGSKPQ